MKPDKNKTKIDNRFQDIWNKFKDNHIIEGYKLSKIFEIYLPFRQCKQNIVIEKDLELDRFSRIILELVNRGISAHAEICAFLGIDDNSFVTIQFHFLLKLGLICESDNAEYEITYQGLSFLENKTKLKNMETVEIEYFVIEQLDYLKNELTQEFFNPNLPIDKQLSASRKKEFSGYQITQSHKVTKSETAKEILHNNNEKPTFDRINRMRNDFASFCNSLLKEGVFYDFADSTIETYRRNICFLGLLYEHENVHEDVRLDIRQHAKSVHNFNKKNELESKLTEKVTKYYNKNPF